jgi:DNA-binding NarL/FixJ family response regulator
MDHSSPSLIRVLFVDDHPLMREGIAAVVRHEADMQIVAEAVTGRQAVELHRQHRPDITLMDVRLPDISGIEALGLIRREFKTARVLMLTTFEGDADMRRALEAGAQAYLLKSMPRSELIEAIRRVHTGNLYVPAEVAENLAKHLGRATLSQREMEVLAKVAEGNRNVDIGQELFISEETVKGHMKHILEKLGANDRAEAVAIAVRRGIIKL